ncbi:retrovirus-related pol polyprotein from transposon TNT 1-94 [Tanacetum coccineum]
MTLYNALARKEYERVFICKTTKELWHTLIITHQDNSQVKNCKIVLLTQEYEKFSISNEETIDSRPPKKVKSLALKAKVTREQTSDDSDSQGGSDEDIDEEEAEAFNLLARNFRKFFRKGNRFVHGNGFSNGGHFASEYREPKENKAFIGGAWSDSERTNDKHSHDEKRVLEDKKSKLSSKINDLEIEVKKIFNDKEVVEPCQKCVELTQEVYLKCYLLPDDLIMDSGCTKYMTGNRRLFTSYKEYDDGHVVFGSNLKGQLCDDDCVVSFTKVDCTISKNGKMLAKGHRRNDVYTFKLGDNSKQQICLASVVDNSMLWHRRLGHANMRIFCEQHGMSYNLSGPFTSQSSEIVKRTHRKLRKMSRAMLTEQSIPQKFWCHELDMATYIFNRVYIRTFINKTPYEILRNKKPSLEYFKVFGCKVFIINTKVHLTKFDPKSYEGVFLGYSQTSKTYIVLNKETMRIEESLNVTFDESLPEPKSSSLVEDDRINEPIVQDLNGSSSLQVNVSDEGYPKSLKEARGHPIEQVIGELNERKLRSKSKQA